MTNTPATPTRFGTPHPKVAPFARYEGTSAWRKDRKRVREYNRFRAAQAGRATAQPPQP